MRRLWQSLALVFGLLCAGTLGLFLRSYWVKTGVWNERLHVHVAEGSVSLAVYTPGMPGRWIPYDLEIDGGKKLVFNGGQIEISLSPLEMLEAVKTAWMSDRPDESAGGFWLLGFRVGDWKVGQLRCLYLAVPLYFPTLVFGLIGGLCFGAARRVVAPGRCPSCGYDLRATPGRCPECGAGAPAARPAGADNIAARP